MIFSTPVIATGVFHYIYFCFAYLMPGLSGDNSMEKMQ
ncbi:hypothetical protein L579_2291 [Pantoea sp. AS-PWVM4]|nr:hypothetical protein L579_2291 [Pantoea sp. AS-PWVM4]